MRRRAFLTGVGLAAGSFVAAPARADCNESLLYCDFTQDETVMVPAEGRQLNVVLEPRNQGNALRVYESIVPNGFEMPEDPVVGLWMVEADAPRRFDDEYSFYRLREGSIAILVRNCKRDELGWYHLSQPTDDEGAYDSGREVGFPKYMLDLDIEREDDSICVHGDVHGREAFEWHWHDGDADPSEILETWTRYEHPFFGVYPVFEGPEMNRVKFTPKATVPVDDLTRPTTGEETPAGLEGVTKKPDIECGPVDYRFDPDLDAIHQRSAECYDYAEPMNDLFSPGESLADIVDPEGTVAGARWEVEGQLVVQGDDIGEAEEE